MIVKWVNNYIRKQKIQALYSNPKIIVDGTAKITHPEGIYTNSGKITIGKNTLINYGCSIVSGYEEIRIGNNVLIGDHTVINTIKHNFDKIDTPINQQGTTEKPIIIEDDVWIAAHCTIIQGVTIGKHSVIGAHSLVTKDIPPYSIAYGVPARKIKTRKNE
ncbi:MAG: acyltransferase [Candidatus Bathyarchaeota archaeon]|nr:acyltransferase [Candidatus Bathyarchaeota archaeon]